MMNAVGTKYKDTRGYIIKNKFLSHPSLPVTSQEANIITSFINIPIYMCVCDIYKLIYAVYLLFKYKL